MVKFWLKLGAEGFEEAEGSSAVVAEPQSQSIPTNQDCACISSHYEKHPWTCAQAVLFEALSLRIGVYDE